MISIQNTLKEAQYQLKDISQTPKLDAEVLLYHSIEKQRDYLYHHDHICLTQSQLASFQRSIKCRLKGEPIAYLLGFKEFWSLSFKVTPDTLIPRPETECLIEWALNTLPKDDTSANIADLGTGSGAIAIALAYERPKWQITATDISAKTLAVARINAKQHSTQNVFFHLNQHHDHWCWNLPNGPFTAIIANPPYISRDDTSICPFASAYEPKKALFSDEDGLLDLKKIITEAKNSLKSNGFLALEHGYLQADRVTELMRQSNYRFVKTYQDLSGLDRITVGMK